MSAVSGGRNPGGDRCGGVLVEGVLFFTQSFIYEFTKGFDAWSSLGI